MEGKFVVFRLGEEKFGVPIQSVERILPVSPLTKIPKSPKTLVGMFAYQGSTVSVIDAAARFELPIAGPAHHFLVIATDFGRYAIQVESVDKIVEYREDEWDEAQDLLSCIERDLAYGVGKKEEELCLLLKPEAIVPNDLRKRMEKQAA
ncbi:MAG: purine-binding chemotaxis protein CheW [Armatimonadetes bacterium]|nr:purine-binding chemotaxis protein CheW [Armatimonadota bacterium]MBS1727417.1 purine-binding chemotaxis protein CheW [Armatimonadota bacterium]